MFQFSFIKNLLSRIYDFFTSSLVLINNFRKNEFCKAILRRLRRFTLAMIIFKLIPYIANDFFKCPYDFPIMIQILNHFSDSYSRITSNLDVNYHFIQIEETLFTDILNISSTDGSFTWLTTPVDSVTPTIHITETTGCETILSKLSLVFGMLYSPPYDKIKGSVYSENVFDTICYKLQSIFSSWMWVSDDLDETKIGLDVTSVEKIVGIIPQEYWVALLFIIIMSIIWNIPNWATPDEFYPEEYSSNEICMVDNDKSIELIDYNTLFNFGKLDNYRSIFDTIKTAYNQVNHIESDTDILNKEKLSLLSNLHEYLRDKDIIKYISNLENTEDKKKLTEMFQLYNEFYLERLSIYSDE